MVNRYFETFNNDDFETTASLFTADSVLNAPFEDPLTGYCAIASYLNTEAQGMEVYS